MAETDQLVSEIELDFHVEFPTPRAPTDDSERSSPNGEREVDDFELMWPPKKGDEEEKPLLIILLGWAGSQDKHVAKYSDFYLKRGCVVLRYITPIKYLVLDAGKLPVLAARFVRLIQDLQLDTHPTFFHVFSNGGSFMYSYIIRELAHHRSCDEKQSSLQKYKAVSMDIRGTIFDSAPAPRRLHTLFRALLNIFADYRLLRYVIASMFVLVLVAQIFWFQLKSCMHFCLVGEGLEERVGPISTATRPPARLEATPLQNWLTRICRLRNHNFQFIYSDADELISDKEIEKIALVLRERGNTVQQLKFKGSEHVQHYRRYPKEYVDTITRFVRTTMEANSGPVIFWDEFN